MTADAYVPTPQDKFSFGIWTVGWQGVDVFGGAVRPPMPADRAVRKLAELGAYGVNFHDNDVFGFDDSPGERDRKIGDFRRALDDTGLVVTTATTNLFGHPDLQGRGVHRRRPGRAAVRAGQDDAQPRPRRRAGREGLCVLGRPGRRGVGGGQGHPGGPVAVQGGPGPAGGLRPRAGVRPAVRDRAEAERAARATSCCPPPGTRWRSSTSSSTPRWSGINPEVGHEEMASLNYAHGISQALWHGKLFHIDLNGQNGPALRPGPAVRRRERPGRVLGGGRPGDRRL